MGSKEKAYPAWHEILHRARHGRVAFDSMPGEFYGVAGYHQLHCVVRGSRNIVPLLLLMLW